MGGWKKGWFFFFFQKFNKKEQIISCLNRTFNTSNKKGEKKEF